MYFASVSKAITPSTPYLLKRFFFSSYLVLKAQHFTNWTSLSFQVGFTSQTHSFFFKLFSFFLSTVGLVVVFTLCIFVCVCALSLSPPWVFFVPSVNRATRRAPDGQRHHRAAHRHRQQQRLLLLLLRVLRPPALHAFRRRSRATTTTTSSPKMPDRWDTW